MNPMSMPMHTGDKSPFTYDVDAVSSIDNILTEGAVKWLEASPNFPGWIVCRVRPLKLCKCDERDVLMYSPVVTIFQHYGEAVDACVETFRLSIAKPYPAWFRNGKFKIFPLERKT